MTDFRGDETDDEEEPGGLGRPPAGDARDKDDKPPVDVEEAEHNDPTRPRSTANPAAGDTSTPDVPRGAVSQSRSIDSLLTEAGFSSLDHDPSHDDLEHALHALQVIAKDVPRLRRRLIRSAAIAALKRVEVKQPAELVDAALSEERGADLAFVPTEPAAEPVTGADLFDELLVIVRAFCVLNPHAAVAVVLWIALSYVFMSFGILPLLNVSSPDRRCGKTTLLSIISALVRSPLFVSNVSAAVLFRTIELYQPTLLIDEADSHFKGNESIRNILNAGHTRLGAFVLRAALDRDGNYVPRKFSVWTPKVVAGIGALHETLEDRSIRVVMIRRLPNEDVASFRQDQIHDLLESCRARLARWAVDNADALKSVDPTMPPGLSDRAADNWRPLLAIADAAGGQWPAFARAAVVAALAPSEAGTAVESVQEMLLGDVKAAFDSTSADRIKTEELLRFLHGLEERPWRDFRDGRPMNPRDLASVLKAYGVASKALRLGDRILRGYEREQFNDAFRRFLSMDNSKSERTIEGKACRFLDEV